MRCESPMLSERRSTPAWAFILVLALVALIVAGCQSEQTGVTAAGPGSTAPAGEDPDLQVLRQLEAAGSDLSKEHLIEFFLYFPTEAEARAAAGEIAADDFDAVVEPAASDGLWLCFARKSMVPDHQLLVDIGATFESIADRYGGEYDGWGTEVVE